jgi:hypothetical protein
MIFEAKRKKVILGILLLFIIFLVFASYDYLFFVPDLEINQDLYAMVELERVPSWQRDYRLSREESSRILNILRNVELRNVATSGFTYLPSEKVYSVHLHNELNNRPEYSVLINETQNFGRILKTDGRKAFVFEILDKDMIYIDELFKKYHDLAFENDINKNVSYELNMLNTEEDYTEYTLALKSFKGDIHLLSNYVALKKDYKYSYLFLRNQAEEKESITINFKIHHTSNDPYEEIRVILRGEVEVDGKLQQFQKVIEI